MKTTGIAALAAAVLALPGAIGEADAACESKSYYNTNNCSSQTSVRLDPDWGTYYDWWEVGDDGSGTLGVAYTRLTCHNAGVTKTLYSGLVNHDPAFGPVETYFLCDDAPGTYPFVRTSRCGNEVACQ